MSSVRIIGSVLGRILRLRYIVLTGAVGGGIAANQKYESFKDQLPDMGWLKEYMPDSERVESMKQRVHTLFRDAKSSMPEIQQWMPQEFPRLRAFREWLDREIARDSPLLEAPPETATPLVVTPIKPILGQSSSSSEKVSQDKMHQIQEEAMHMQLTTCQMSSQPHDTRKVTDDGCTYLDKIRCGQNRNCKCRNEGKRCNGVWCRCEGTACYNNDHPPPPSQK